MKPLAILLTLFMAALAAGAPRLFDFGVKDAPPPQGFVKVSGADAYSATRGYGWEKIWGFDWIRPEIADPLTRDGICARGHVDESPEENNVTFRVDIPNGVYQVTAWVGDPAKNEGRQGICAATNGRVVLPPPGVGGWGAVTEVTLPAVVEDEALRVNFFITGKGGAARLSVLGLKIEPVTDPAAQAALRRRWGQESAPVSAKPREIEVAGKKYTEVGRRNEVPLDAIPAEWKDVPLLTYTRAAPGYILSYSIPKPGELTRSLAAFAVPDDDQPLYFGAYAARAVEDVRIHVSDLTCPAGLIPASQVQIYTQATRPRALSDRPGSSARLVADLLDAYAPFALPQGATQPIYLIVHVPPGQPAGVYSGVITLSPAALPSVALEIKLRVLPFELAKPKGKSWNLFTDSHRWIRMGREAAEREVADMARHGINSLSIGYPPVTGAYVERDGKLVDADYGTAADALRHGAHLGMDGPCLIAATPGILLRLRGWTIAHKGQASHAYSGASPARAIALRHAAADAATSLAAAAGSLLPPDEPLRLEVRYKLQGKGAACARLQFMRSYKREPVDENLATLKLPPTDG
ncbi:MAG TPA: hypothetical protein P5137_13330, partial [Candidatus Brocadiia bacterium]|nr:hypothetical protein [Candidatus Brocadiia bacterium]